MWRWLQGSARSAAKNAPRSSWASRLPLRSSAASSGAGCVGLFTLPMWTMYAVAASAGFCLGGVWASDRPYMLRLTPPDRIGEFYGLYGMVGRFSAVTGPLIWAASTALTNQVFHLDPLASQGI